MQTTRNAPVDPDALGRAVRQARTRQSLGTAELACTLGVSQERIEAIENGQEDPGYKLLRAIARTLGIASSALLAQVEAWERQAGPDLSVKAILARHNERALTPAEFQEYFGELPTDGEG